MPPVHGTFQIDTGGFHPGENPLPQSTEVSDLPFQREKSWAGWDVPIRRCFANHASLWKPTKWCSTVNRSKWINARRAGKVGTGPSRIHICMSADHPTSFSNIMEGPCRRVKWATSHANPQAGEIQTSSRPCTTCCNYIHMIHMIGW